MVMAINGVEDRPVHPLKAWRLTQTYPQPKTGRPVPMAVSEAARRVGCSVPTWIAWEKYPDEPGHMMPSHENMMKIFRMSDRQVRPDHFHLYAVAERRAS